MLILSFLVIAIVLCVLYLVTVVKDPIFKQAIIIVGMLLAFITLIFEPWQIQVVAISLPLLLGSSLEVI